MTNFSGLPLGMPFGPDERSTTQELPLGTRAYDSAGNEYIYVKAEGAIAAKEAVYPTTASLSEVSKTAAVNQLVLGCATYAFADEEYGFILHRGVGTVLATDNHVGFVVSGATAGTLSNISASSAADNGGSGVADSKHSRVYIPTASASSSTNGVTAFFL